MVVFSAWNYGIAYVFYGVTPTQLPLLLDDLGTARAIEIAKVLQFFSSVGFFILPAFLLAYLFSDKAKGYLKLDYGVNTYSVIFVVVAVIIAIPLINYLGAINSKLVLPDFLGGVETVDEGQ